MIKILLLFLIHPKRAALVKCLVCRDWIVLQTQLLDSVPLHFFYCPIFEPPILVVYKDQTWNFRSIAQAHPTYMWRCRNAITITHIRNIPNINCFIAELGPQNMVSSFIRYRQRTRCNQTQQRHTSIRNYLLGVHFYTFLLLLINFACYLHQL